MWRCMHIECLSVATSQPLPPRLCFSSPTLPASTLAPHKFSPFYFSGLRPQFPVGASPCKIPRHVNHHTYLAASSRDRPGFVGQCLLHRPPAPLGFTLWKFRDLRHPFSCGGITSKYLYITVYICVYVLRPYVTTSQPLLPRLRCRRRCLLRCVYKYVFTYVRDYF